MIGPPMVSPRRREVLIAALATTVAPTVLAALPARGEKLILSGRVLGADGEPLAGAIVAADGAQATTDTDGRFMLFARTGPRGITCDGRSTEGFVPLEERRDSQGTWRATVALTV